MYDIDRLLTRGAELGASDIHLTVGVPPKYRVNGSLISYDSEKLNPVAIRELAYNMMGEQLQRRYEERGEIDFAYSVSGIGRFRVNAYHQRSSSAVTIRLISEEIPLPEALSIPRSVVELTKKRRGLVLVTGPTGSGKSTTLASLIDYINNRYEYNIITLEDPIEYLHSHRRSIVNQREVGIDTQTFADALRAAMREDPDVILVGEMRDAETIATAITAAETGHLVFSTLHTTGAASTIDRIIDVFPPHQQSQVRTQLGMVLEGVISQQLLPTMDGTGRRAAFEVMLATPAIRNMIREGKAHQITGTLQINRSVGMQTMDDSIYDLFRCNAITSETALAYSVDLKSMVERPGI